MFSDRDCILVIIPRKVSVIIGITEIFLIFPVVNGFSQSVVVALGPVVALIQLPASRGFFGIAWLVHFVILLTKILT